MAEEKGSHNMEISDSDKKLDALADMIRDACMKMDEGSKRLDSRMDAMEAEHKRRADAEKEEGDKREDSEKEVEEKGEPKEVAADKGRKDSEEDVKRAQSETKVDRKDARKDAEEGEAEADSAPMTRAEAAALRAEIARLSARAPAILADADRERFADIQVRADSAFQAFGERAPGPLEGETPTQYKRRIGAKLQAHSPKWKDTRLSAIADDATLDVIMDDIYADSIAAARRGVDVPRGHLREVKTRNDAGHTFIAFEGSPSSWMNPLAGRAQAATGNWKVN